MMLVLEARRLPFATVSAERAASAAKTSGWSSSSLSSLTNWDKCMLPAILPLLREGRSAATKADASTLATPDAGCSNANPSTSNESQSTKGSEKEQQPEAKTDDKDDADEVRVTRKILKELSELEAAYHQMKDARQHIRYLNEDRERMGAIMNEEGANNGEYSWWPTDDDFLPTSCNNFIPGRAEEMASLQARTGFTLEEESFFASLVQHQKLLGGEDLDDVLFGKNVDRKQLAGGGGTKKNSVEKEEEEVPVAEGMDPGIDIAMSFDLSQGGEPCGIGSAAIFGGHGIHFPEPHTN